MKTIIVFSILVVFGLGANSRFKPFRPIVDRSFKPFKPTIHRSDDGKFLLTFRMFDVDYLIMHDNKPQYMNDFSYIFRKQGLFCSSL